MSSDRSADVVSYFPPGHGLSQPSMAIERSCAHAHPDGAAPQLFVDAAGADVRKDDQLSTGLEVLHVRINVGPRQCLAKRGHVAAVPDRLEAGNEPGTVEGRPRAGDDEEGERGQGSRVHLPYCPGSAPG